MDKGVTCKIREFGQILKDRPDQELNDGQTRKLRQEISHLLNFPGLIADHPETFVAALTTYCDRAGAVDVADNFRSWLGRSEQANEPGLLRPDAPQPKLF